LPRKTCRLEDDDCRVGCHWSAVGLARAEPGALQAVELLLRAPKCAEEDLVLVVLLHVGRVLALNLAFAEVGVGVEVSSDLLRSEVEKGIIGVKGTVLTDPLARQRPAAEPGRSGGTKAPGIFASELSFAHRDVDALLLHDIHTFTLLRRSLGPSGCASVTAMSSVSLEPPATPTITRSVCRAGFSDLVVPVEVRSNH